MLNLSDWLSYLLFNFSIIVSPFCSKFMVWQWFLHDMKHDLRRKMALSLEIGLLLIKKKKWTRILIIYFSFWISYISALWVFNHNLTFEFTYSDVHLLPKTSHLWKSFMDIIQNLLMPMNVFSLDSEIPLLPI
jgi:hypothetical protein